MGVSKNRDGPPKWMVKIMKVLIKVDDGWFGGKTPYFWKHPYQIVLRISERSTIFLLKIEILNFVVNIWPKDEIIAHCGDFIHQKNPLENEFFCWKMMDYVINKSLLKWIGLSVGQWNLNYWYQTLDCGDSEGTLDVIQIFHVIVQLLTTLVSEVASNFYFQCYSIITSRSVSVAMLMKIVSCISCFSYWLVFYLIYIHCLYI